MTPNSHLENIKINYLGQQCVTPPLGVWIINIKINILIQNFGVGTLQCILKLPIIIIDLKIII